jgi:hypothetical protein
MGAVSIPWAALVALGSAVAAIITALWAKLRQVERARDEWTERWAAEVKRSPQDDSDLEEKTDIRNRRKDILKQFEEDKKRRRKEEDDRLRAYVDGQSTPPRFRR